MYIEMLDCGEYGYLSCLVSQHLHFPLTVLSHPPTVSLIPASFPSALPLLTYPNLSLLITHKCKNITNILSYHRFQIIKQIVYAYLCRMCLLYGFLLFFFRHDITQLSSSLSVEGFRVSKSISISSGFESRKDGSLD